jgi:hypothetical protein
LETFLVYFNQQSTKYRRIAHRRRRKVSRTELPSIEAPSTLTTLSGLDLITFGEGAPPLNIAIYDQFRPKTYGDW